MKTVHMIAFILLLIGGLNWLIVAVTGDKDLFGLLNMNMGDTIPRVVYALVGLSAIYIAVTHKSACKDCMVGGSSGQGAMM